MSKLKKSFAELDCAPHEHEAMLLEIFQSGDPETGAAVKEARSIGISWQSIAALLAQFGPQFSAMIYAIVAALNTPVPKPMAERTAEPKPLGEDETTAEHHHGKRHKAHAEE